MFGSSIRVIYPANLYADRRSYHHAEYREHVTKHQIELMRARGIWRQSLTHPRDRPILELGGGYALPSAASIVRRRLSGLMSVQTSLM